MNWERKRSKLCNLKGVSITQRRGGWRVYLGKSITRGKVYEKQHSELIDAVKDVEDWLEVKNQATNAARILSDAQMEDALAANNILKKNNVELTLLEITRSYLSRLPKGANKSHKKLASLYLKEAEVKGRSPKYIKGIDYQIRKFLTVFGDQLLTDADPDDLEEWLGVTCIGLAPNTYNHHLTLLKAMYNFAVKRSWLLENPISHLEKIKHIQTEPCIFSVKDLKKVLEHCRENNLWDELLAYGIQAFAGIRKSEVFSLDWNAIHQDSIRVTGKSSKINKGRGVPVLPSLRVILNLYQRNCSESELTGKVIKISDKQWSQSRIRITKTLGIAWGHNQLRHSFVSYRLAVTKNISQTSYESGHTPDVMLSHYDAVVSAEEAKKYFKLLLS